MQRSIDVVLTERLNQNVDCDPGEPRTVEETNKGYRARVRCRGPPVGSVLDGRPVTRVGLRLQLAGHLLVKVEPCALHRDGPEHAPVSNGPGCFSMRAACGGDPFHELRQFNPRLRTAEPSEGVSYQVVWMEGLDIRLFSQWCHRGEGALVEAGA